MLHDEIERCFGGGPEHRPVEQRIAAGRRALRRRRAAAALTAVGMVAVVGSTYALAVPGQDSRARGEMTVRPTLSSPPPTPAQPTSPLPDPTATSQPWQPNLYARHTDDGELEIRPGVVVHERIENPFGWEPPRLADALDVSWKGRRIWTIVELGQEGLVYRTTEPGNEWAGFAEWVAYQSQLMSDTPTGYRLPVRLREDGRVVATHGTEILQRTDEPRLGDGFAPPGTRTGAALVDLGGDAPSRFVFWRVVGSELDVFNVAPDELIGATFEEMLSYARRLYAESGRR